ncbi:MAG TPA: tyrosine-type recombinase/integrase [Bryobacteraceae bacterium]|nr:tyrosine-type recombinase/integrase [Bryobacteraceae bacterium]
MSRPKVTKIKSGSFAAVVRAFLMSPKFEALSRSTQVHYRHLLNLAERSDILGAIPVDEMRPALVQAFLDGLADRPAQQKCAQTAIKSLERWALVRDLLPRQITLGTEAPGGTGGHVPWTDEQVALAEQYVRPHLARVITLAANTGQRGSDLVRMRWTDIEEVEGRPGIQVKQVKTGLELWVPFTAALQAAIASWERRPGFILLKEDGHPFTRQQLSDQWLRERNTKPALAPLKEAGLVMHGLRGTAVVRLRRAGATIPQIGDMVGMSPLMVTRYCRYSIQRENALAAVYNLDKAAIDRARDKKRGGE